MLRTCLGMQLVHSAALRGARAPRLAPPCPVSHGRVQALQLRCDFNFSESNRRGLTGRGNRQAAKKQGAEVFFMAVDACPGVWNGGRPNTRNRRRPPPAAQRVIHLVKGICNFNAKQLKAVSHLLTPDLLAGVAIAGGHHAPPRSLSLPGPPSCRPCLCGCGGVVAL